MASDCWLIIYASCRYTGLNEFTGSVEALGKLTKLTELYVGAGAGYTFLCLMNLAFASAHWEIRHHMLIGVRMHAGEFRATASLEVLRPSANSPN